jgi:hypothetical protein
MIMAANSIIFQEYLETYNHHSNADIMRMGGLKKKISWGKGKHYDFTPIFVI